MLEERVMVKTCQKHKGKPVYVVSEDFLFGLCWERICGLPNNPNDFVLDIGDRALMTQECYMRRYLAGIMDNRMTPDKYQELCMRTCSKVASATSENLILQGVMGMSGESGEALDIVKKYFFQGHDIDKEHLVRELGDVLWYVATCARGLGVSLEEVMTTNINKLKERYPDHFDSDLSMHRKEGDV